jgi:benzoyl-CoA reductase/2-hydroxyglutaryl-CoA dehydratase subunit BcrC/BadD/HgdB
MVTEQKRAINRLESRKLLRPMLDAMYDSGGEAVKAGKPVAWCMVNFWEGDPILRAMDVTAIYPENYGTVCAAMGAAQEYLGRSEGEGFPTHLCGYARNCFGYTSKMIELGDTPPAAPLGGMAKPTFMLSSGAMCDARYKWFQALRRYWDVPLWVLEMPHPGVHEIAMEGALDYTIKYVVAELREFVAFLERLLGKKMDWDRLHQLLDSQEKVFEVWGAANELRKSTPCPMHARDFWTMMVPAYYMAAMPGTLEAYQEVYDEVKSRVDAGIGSVANEKYRLGFAELPPWHSLDFFNDLAERGWNFVTESPGYHPPPLSKTERVSDPLERIARLIFENFFAGFMGAGEQVERSAGTGELYLKLARDFRVDGMLFHPLLSCRTATFYLTHAANVLLERARVPSFLMQGDIVDLTVFDPTRALSEAEAFEETMDHYRELRKKEGLGW